MTGLFFLAIVGLWMWFAFKTSKVVSSWVTQGRWRWPVAALLFVVLLPLPVLDELIARPQIERLCREGAVLKIDEQKIKGRRVKSSGEPSNAAVPGTAIRVTFTRAVYRDENTGEELASMGYYVITGGWLIRTLGISESNSPLFVREGCASSKGVRDSAERLNFKIIN